MSDPKKSERSDPVKRSGLAEAFRKYWNVTCSCPGLDVRVEDGKVECGKCGAAILRAVVEE